MDWRIAHVGMGSELNVRWTGVLLGVRQGSELDVLLGVVEDRNGA